MTNAKVIKEQTRTELLERVQFLERVAEQAVDAGELRLTNAEFGKEIVNASFYIGDVESKLPDLAAYLREPALPLPQPEPLAEGDAISRKWLLDRTHDTSFIWGRSDARRLVEEAPAIPCAQPEAGVDCATVEDVVEGIEWMAGIERLHVGSASKSAGATVWNSGDRDCLILSLESVADLLNGALRRGGTVTWPEGHRRNPKPKEPTLLEAAEAFMSTSTKKTKDYEKLKAAVERERKEATSGE